MIKMIRELNEQVKTLILLQKNTQMELIEVRKQLEGERTTALISTSDPFIYHNPLMTPDESAEAALEEISFQSSHFIQTALVVDDDPLFRRLLIQQLANLSIEATGVGSGREALEEVKLQQYDLIVMDLRMPGMDGLSTARAIRREEQRRTPILTVTSAAEEEERCRVAGMDAFLAKPVSLNQLSQALEKLQQSPAAESPSTGKMCFLITENGLHSFK